MVGNVAYQVSITAFSWMLLNMYAFPQVVNMCFFFYNVGFKFSDSFVISMSVDVGVRNSWI